MPTLKIPDGEIYYEVHGSGYPLMIFAPGGLRSELAFWRHSPSNPSAPAVWMDPMTALGGQYRVVAMDQRNAGRSRRAGLRLRYYRTRSATPTTAPCLRTWCRPGPRASASSARRSTSAPSAV